MIKSYILTIQTNNSTELQNKVRLLRELFPDIVVWKGKVPAEISSTEYFQLSIPAIRERRRILSPVEVACSISHLEIMKNFISGSENILIIFEDDVIVPHKFNKNSLAEVIGKIGTCDILIAGSQDGNDSDLWGQKIFDNPDVYALSALSRPQIYGSFAYFCGRKAVEWAIKNQNNSLTFADAFEYLANPQGRLLYSNIFCHPNENSTSRIESQRSIALQAFLTANKPKRLLTRIIDEILASITSRRFFKYIKRQWHHVFLEPLNVKIKR